MAESSLDVSVLTPSTFSSPSTSTYSPVSPSSFVSNSATDDALPVVSPWRDDQGESTGLGSFAPTQQEQEPSIFVQHTAASQPSSVHDSTIRPTSMVATTVTSGDNSATSADSGQSWLSGDDEVFQTAPPSPEQEFYDASETALESSDVQSFLLPKQFFAGESTSSYVPPSAASVVDESIGTSTTQDDQSDVWSWVPDTREETDRALGRSGENRPLSAPFSDTDLLTIDEGVSSVMTDNDASSLGPTSAATVTEVFAPVQNGERVQQDIDMTHNDPLSPSASFDSTDSMVPTRDAESISPTFHPLTLTGHGLPGQVDETTFGAADSTYVFGDGNDPSTTSPERSEGSDTAKDAKDNIQLMDDITHLLERPPITDQTETESVSPAPLAATVQTEGVTDLAADTEQSEGKSVGNTAARAREALLSLTGTALQWWPEKSKLKEMLPSTSKWHRPDWAKRDKLTSYLPSRPDVSIPDTFTQAKDRITSKMGQWEWSRPDIKSRFASLASHVPNASSMFRDLKSRVLPDKPTDFGRREYESVLNAAHSAATPTVETLQSAKDSAAPSTMTGLKAKGLFDKFTSGMSMPKMNFNFSLHRPGTTQAMNSWLSKQKSALGAIGSGCKNSSVADMSKFDVAPTLMAELGPDTARGSDSSPSIWGQGVLGSVLNAFNEVNKPYDPLNDLKSVCSAASSISRKLFG